MTNTLCAKCKKPGAIADVVMDTEVLELCRACLGETLATLAEENFRVLITRWRVREDGYLKLVIE